MCVCVGGGGGMIILSACNTQCKCLGDLTSPPPRCVLSKLKTSCPLSNRHPEFGCPVGLSDSLAPLEY